MARRFRTPVLTLAFLFSSLMGLAQAPKTHESAPLKQPNQPASQVWIGRSVLPLYGPWKFTLGDSPVDPATQKLVWAESGFDDSQWESVDLSPMPGWSDPYNGDPRYVPGWTAKGHPGYIGWAWYRLRVPVAARDGVRFALGSPIYVDDGYQVYANGVLLGSSGDFSHPGVPPTVYATGPAMYPLPQGSVADHDRAGPPTQLVAFRVWMGPMGLSHSPYAGGLHYAPTLGEVGAIAAQTRLGWVELTLESAFAPFEGILLFLLGLVAAGLILFDRSDRVYLWIAGVLMFTALSDAALTVFTLRRVLSLRTYFMFFDVFTNPIELCGWVMVWWFWFQLRRPVWVPKVLAGLLLLFMILKAVGGNFFYGELPQALDSLCDTTSVIVRLLILPLLILIVVLGIRKQGAEGLLVLPAVIPLAISQFASELIVLNLPVKWSPFGITIFVGQVANLVSAAAISLLMLRRLQLSVRRQRELALDLKQAREMQRMLIPESRLELPGYRLSTAYRPALEVGGDFYQIIPREGGGLQIVLGDVSGKGLRAAMAVSLILGTIRVLADDCSGPAELLHQMNRRLLGRLYRGFATCVAIWIGPDGNCTIAGAGHPSPYLNDQEINVSGALPLGLEQEGIYEEKAFQLRPGDCLTLYTDGLPEARNGSGELYGFIRLKKLIATRPTAEQAAAEAEKFGQDDDITVLTLTRISPSSARG